MRVFCLLLLVAVPCLAFTVNQQAIPEAINWPFSVCGNGTWTMKNLMLGAAPSKNNNDSVDAFGVANDYTEFDHVDLTVKLNGLFLHNETESYKKTFDAGDLIEYKYVTFIPGFAPAGNYVLSFSFKDTSNKENGCWSFTFKL